MVRADSPLRRLLEASVLRDALTESLVAMRGRAGELAQVRGEVAELRASLAGLCTGIGIRTGTHEADLAQMRGELDALRSRLDELEEAASKAATAARVPEPAGTTGGVVRRASGLCLVKVPAGSFVMGSPDEEQGHVRDEAQTNQRLDRFLMSDTPITCCQFHGVWRTGNGGGTADLTSDCPVTYVSVLDAAQFCNALSRRDGFEEAYEIEGSEVSLRLGRAGFRLPSEPEWEYACRGQSTANRYGRVREIAWYMENSRDRVRPVRGKAPNAYGLFDMLGNVYEWCWDPTPPRRKVGMPIRGASYEGLMSECRAARRDWRPADTRAGDLGFRVVRSW